MFSRLFSKREARVQSSTPPDCVIWAIGDIHGRADLADRLCQAIQVDLHICEASRKVIVFLGDYVDRGFDSKGVLDQICSLSADPTLEVHLLRGNHEDRMEAFLEDPRVGPSWCDYGGRETLKAYGVHPPDARDEVDAWAEASRSFNSALPPEHRDLFLRMENSLSIGDYFFAHAGARPGVALSEQAQDDLLWIRQPFLDHKAVFEQVVVHGHTPCEDVYSDQRRIGVDTGAYATNLLSAVRLERHTRILLQALGRANRIKLTTSALVS